MNAVATKPSQTLRVILIAGALAVLGVWAWAWTPVIEAWDNPADGGFSAIPAVMATFTLLPLAVFALFNALQNRRGGLTSAALALGVCVLLLGAVAGIELYGNYLEALDAARA